MARPNDRRNRETAARRRELTGCEPYEVFPGWSVVQDWETALRETWAERKARRAEGRPPTTLPPGRR